MSTLGVETHGGRVAMDENPRTVGTGASVETFQLGDTLERTLRSGEIPSGSVTTRCREPLRWVRVAVIDRA